MDQYANDTTTLSNIEATIQNVDTDNATYETNENYSYLLAAINILIGIVTDFGNGLVLYAAYGNRNNGRLNHLDSVIKSLAVNDLIYGLFGILCRTLARLYEIGFLHSGKQSNIYLTLSWFECTIFLIILGFFCYIYREKVPA